METKVLQDGTKNYLQMIGIQGENYSEKILCYQDIPGFLPVEIRTINGIKEYVYDISGKIPVSQYLIKGNFGVSDLRRIFARIFSMLAAAEDYLLDSRGIVIETEFLYCDPGTNELWCIFCADDPQNPVQKIGRFLEEIMEKMNQRDKELVFFVYGMHKLTKEAGCTCHTLEKYVTRERREDTIFPDQIKGRPQEYKNPQIVQYSEKSQKLREYGLPIAIFLGSAVVYVALWMSGIFQKPVSGRPDLSKAVGMSLFLAAVAGFGIWKTLPDKKVPIIEKIIRGAEKKTEVMFFDESNEQKKVCLIPQKGADAPIEVHHFPFVYEKLQIQQEAGNIFVMDEESDSGIYCNGTRLVPWSRTMVYDGDVLYVADRSYVVEITMSYPV